MEESGKGRRVMDKEGGGILQLYAAGESRFCITLLRCTLCTGVSFTMSRYSSVKLVSIFTYIQ